MSNKRAAIWATVVLAVFVGWFALALFWLPGFLAISALIALSTIWFMMFVGFSTGPSRPPPMPWEDEP